MDVGTVARQHGVSEAVAQRRINGYQTYIASKGEGGRGLVFYSRHVPMEEVLRDGAGCGFEVSWRASVHFSWFHVLNSFPELLHSGRDVLTGTHYLVHGMRVAVQALERGTIAVRRPCFPLTLMQARTMALHLAADHCRASITMAIVAVAAWKCGRANIEVWEAEAARGVDMEEWCLDAEATDAMTTIFLNAGLPDMGDAARETLRARVLNAAFVMHACANHDPVWDVRFHGMDACWPALHDYLHSLPKAKEAEDAGGCVAWDRWAFAPAGAIAAAVFAPLPLPELRWGVDIACGLGACRADPSAWSNTWMDFAWMVVAAYASHYPVPGQPLPDVCSMLLGIGADTTTCMMGAIDTDARLGDPPVTWAQVRLPCLRSMVGCGGAVDVGPVEREGPGLVPPSAYGILDRQFSLIAGRGMRALVIMGAAPECATPDLEFAWPAFAPVHFSKQARVYRQLGAMERVAGLWDDPNDLRAWCAMAVFMDPDLESAWELADCPARAWLAAYCHAHVGNTWMEDAVCVRGPWVTTAGAALWWWVLQPGRTPATWAHLLSVLVEACARWPQHRPLLAWGVVARLWAKRYPVPGVGCSDGGDETMQVSRLEGHVLASIPDQWERGDPVLLVGAKQWMHLTVDEVPTALGAAHHFLHDTRPLEKLLQHIVFQQDWDLGVSGGVLDALVGCMRCEDEGRDVDTELCGVWSPQHVDEHHLQGLASTRDFLTSVQHTVSRTRRATSTNVVLALYSCNPCVAMRTVIQRFAARVVHASAVLQ